MFFNFAAIVLLLSICAGKEATSNQAVSSQSYHREDVPLSYKFTSIHAYTTAKPSKSVYIAPYDTYDHPAKNSLNFRAIQYAPLGNVEELNRLNGLYTKISTSSSTEVSSTSNNHSTEIALKKSHLEPRLETEEPGVQPDLGKWLHQYIPGHNIEVLQTVNRIPGHNAVYRNYPGNSHVDKQNKRNFLRRFSLIQRNSIPQVENITENTNKTNEFTTLESLKPTNEEFEHPVLKPFTLEEVPIEKPHLEIPRSPNTRIHATLLNVRRSYNHGASPHNKALFVSQDVKKPLNSAKSPIHSHRDVNASKMAKSSAYSLAILNLVNKTPIHPNPLAKAKTHSQALIKMPELSRLDNMPSIQKTLLFPIQKKIHFAIRS